MVVIALLLMLSAFASGSEIAFFSLSPTDIQTVEEGTSSNDALVRKLRRNSERTLATILITNNFVNVTIVMLGNYVFAQTIDFGGNHILQFLVLTVLLTSFILFFGEILPKIFARLSTLGFCRMAARGITFFCYLFWPLENLLLKTSVIAGKVVSDDSYVMGVKELEQALELTDKKDIAEEKSILEGIIQFSKESAKEIMTPRKEMVAINIKAEFSTVLACIEENNYSRIPIYQENRDDIRGIIYIKDLLPHICKADSFRWQSLIRPPYFVPETKKIDNLLREFQENKIHIAIVVDEYGGTSGLVTMEDILEEIVGEIDDEVEERVK
ncbi:MAG: gliding motility-associated protein GldE [Bacteroidaceae bacterium]|nr:gliding motility-associated protein GldE [Bacteroidaceae bacterium]